MNKKINIILLSMAGGIAALVYIIQNVQSGEAGAIIFTVAFLTLMAYKPTRAIIAQLLSTFVNLFTKLADNVDKTSNRSSENSRGNSTPAQKNSSSLFHSQRQNSPTVKHSYCKLCGLSFHRLSDLVNNHCRMNNHGKGLHVVYLGSEKSKYECATCGQTSTSLSALVTNHCRNIEHGKGYHVAKEDWI